MKFIERPSAPGGTPGNYRWECASQFSNPRPYFRPKNVIIHTRFQKWPLRNYVIITQIRTVTRKISLNPLRIRIFLFLSYPFGTETIKRSYTSLVPSKTIPYSRPKSTPVFRLKRYKNPTLLGGTYLKGADPLPSRAQCPSFPKKRHRLNIHGYTSELSFHDISCLHQISSAKTLKIALITTLLLCKQINYSVYSLGKNCDNRKSVCWDFWDLINGRRFKKCV